MLSRVGGAGEGYVPGECVDDGWEKVITCDSGHTRKIQHHCWDRACPRCARAWAVRGSKRSAARLEGLALLFHHLPRHVILSPPPAFFNPRTPLADMREIFRRVAVSSGIHGGAIVIHGWREAHRGEGDWYFSPHAHVVGWGRVATRPVGWVIKVVNTIGNRQHAESTFAYELDHAAYEGGGAAMTWFGSTSYSKVATAYTKTMEPSVCTVCGAVEHEERLDAESGEIVQMHHLEPHFAAKCALRAHKPRSKARKRAKWGSLNPRVRARA